ncbi:MAG: alpha/beta hydrolase [Proteobacteria bacterium]|nr:alpha/beta hydrolase [Pseudomonadota bacterium]
MTVRNWIAAFMLFLPLSAHAQGAQRPEVTDKVAQDGRYPSRAFANGVTEWPDLIYSRLSGYRALTLDLYLPPAKLASPSAGVPLVVYIHGGAWLAGNRRHNTPFTDFPAVLASLAARGYAVASLEYRLSGEAKFPAQIQDVKAAIRWLRAHAAEYNIDPARTMTWGASAGGYLAALAAASCGAMNLEPPPSIAAGPSSANVSDCVQGAVSWYGVFDFSTIAAQAREGHSRISRDRADAPEWRLLGCFAPDCKNGQIAAASVVTYVTRKSPPMLLIVGDNDSIVPHQQTLEMAGRLTAAGVLRELIVMHGIDHSLIGKTLEETRRANLKALDATFRFIDETIGARRSSR